MTGILLAARLGSGNAGAANGLEFDVIAAVVVGGTALSGGRGSLFGTLLGVLVITLIGNGLVPLGINSFFPAGGTRRHHRGGGAGEYLADPAKQ